MRRFFVSFSLALLALSAQAEVINVETAELETLIKSGVPVIDIRTQPEWDQTGVIQGSKLLTFFDENGKHNAPAWLDKVKPYAKPDQPVIVICRSGNRTQAVSNFLSQQAGYAKVYNVKYGINRWLKESRPVVAATPILTACRADKTC